jgi:uncharacterized membrane protein HdeD (DUF308 family)
MSTVVQKAANSVKNWWFYLVIGILLILGSIYVFMTPLASYVSLAIVFSVMMLFDGIATIITSVSNRDIMKGWGWHLAVGLIGTLIGIGLMTHPEVTMIVLPFYVGFWTLMKGSMLIGISFDMTGLALAFLSFKLHHIKQSIGDLKENVKAKIDILK